MGNAVIERQRQLERENLERFVKGLTDGPDLRVNRNIVMFTSLASSDSLRQHYEKRKMEVGDCAADWIKSLAEKLGDLTPAPGLAGLGALAIAVLIDIACLSPPEEDTKEALRCVFAEEKASEVWDQIDECLKRCMMHINNRHELVSDIKRVECQLSAALTKLKNSMVRDGHMSSEALKAWVNGAAFHIQMMIHLVRLGGIQTCEPVERLIWTYVNELDLLFKKHKEVIEGRCSKRLMDVPFVPAHIYLEDEESQLHHLGISTQLHHLGISTQLHHLGPSASFPIIHDDKYFEAYYDRRYSRQKHEIQQYFSDVRQNLQELVHQRGSFSVN